ncbi:MAG: chloride channel protein [Pseudomonadota bacterium]
MAASKLARTPALSRSLKWLSGQAGDPVSTGVAAAMIGVVVGYAALAFRLGIETIQFLSFGTGAEDMVAYVRALPWYLKLGPPILGGVIVATLLRWLLKGQPAGSVADVIEANMVGAGRVPIKSALSSALVSVTALGTGSSVGREGPMIHLGSAFASLVSGWLRAPPASARTLLGCGVAASIAASFNAPIAGVFFALEVVLGSYAIASFAPIVIAGVLGTIITRIHIGDYPAFDIPDYAIISFWEVPGFLILGGMSALVAIGFMRAILIAEDGYQRLPVARWLNPPLAGIVVGVSALVLPELLGVGYGATSDALRMEYDFTLLVVLLIAKILVSAICIAGRFGTGVFSASLFIGAMLGGAFGIAAAGVFPDLAADHGLYAIVGMAAVAGSVMGAPISTILIVFELTGSYQVTLALMGATAVASLISSRLFDISFFNLQLKRRGLALTDSRARLALRRRTVDSVMDQDFVTIRQKTTLGRVRALLATQRRGMLIVVDDEDRFVGEIAFSDLTSDLYDPGLDTLVLAYDLARPWPKVIVAKDNLAQALTLMENRPEDVAPVLDNVQDRHVVGVLHTTDVLAAFNRLLIENEEEMRSGASASQTQKPAQ